jgi:hypothetical protein
MEVAKPTYSIYIYIYIYKAKLKIIRKKLRNNKKNEENYKTTIFWMEFGYVFDQI